VVSEVVTEGTDLARAVAAARARLIDFVGRCSEEQWVSCPLGADDPRPVGVIIDHVADAYEYLGSFVAEITRGEAPTRASALAHLDRSGDAFVALIEPLSAPQLSSGDGRVTVTRFAEIAALHADNHRVDLETALGLAP
jgi:hypothetical protein